MNRTAIYSILMGLIVLMASCNEIVETDLTKKEVHLISPVEGHIYKTYDQTFWWEKVEGASMYQLQVVDSSFERVIRLILDTVVTTSKFSHAIPHGKFQWRVRAQNGSTFTAYSTRRLEIDSVGMGPVSLVRPAQSAIFFLDNEKGRTDIRFEWVATIGASEYVFRLDDKNENNLVMKTLKPRSGNQLQEEVLESAGEYQWRVQASDGISNVSFSESRAFKVVSDKPLLDRPTELESLARDSVVLSWKELGGAGSYLLQIRDKGGRAVKDTTTPQTRYRLYGATIGDTLSWSVKAIDLFNNRSDVSDTRKFIVR